MRILSFSALVLAISFSLFCQPVFANEVNQTRSDSVKQESQSVQETTKPTHKVLLTKANKKIEESSKKVKNSHWYPSYHIAPLVNYMGTPNGFVFFNGKYHLFYQQNPFTPNSKEAYWGHLTSTDLTEWKHEPDALAPSENYDKDGILQGSAIVDDNLLYLLYTGNFINKHNDKKEIHQTQNLAMSKDGINFGKSANNSVIKLPPHYSVFDFSSQDFRAPYVWKQSDRYYALIGSQYEKTKDGAVLLFKSQDLRNWYFINISAIGRNGEIGSMWESPSLVRIGDEDVLIISPEGIKPNGKFFLNKYHSGCFIGKLDYDTGKFKQKGPFIMLDKGFDFYAPQPVKTTDGRTVVVATFNMDSEKLPEHIDGWAGMMTIPRELKIKDGKIVSTPISEITKLRIDPAMYKDQSVNKEREFGRIKGDSYELELEAVLTETNNFSVKLRASSTQETVLSYDKKNKLLTLNRDKSGNSLSGEREAKLNLLDGDIIKLRIFMDKSSVEIFANDGEAVMSSRLYPDKTSTGVKFTSDGFVKLKTLNFYKMKDIN